MNVLTIYAHPGGRCFCRAVLEQFTRGLADAGHSNETVDLYAMRFNPVLTGRDNPNWVDESLPADMLRRMILENSGGSLRRAIVKRWMGDRDSAELVRLIRRFRPRDVVAQQEKVARADGLAIIFPVWFVGFPAILKGWVERVFTYGFAYSMTPEGLAGDIRGRVPGLRNQKALLISTTLFNAAAYEAGLKDAMTKLIDDFGFRYPGIRQVEHVYFYSVGAVSAEVRQGYLQEAYRLGREYSVC